MQEITKQRKYLNINGVESVLSFSEVKIVLVLCGGEKLHIIGTDLKITSFSKSNYAFTAEGNVVGMTYGGKSFVSKIFK